MSGSELAAHYREYAAQCFKIAQNSIKPEDKLALLHMSQCWAVLAEQIERREATSEPDAVRGKYHGDSV